MLNLNPIAVTLVIEATLVGALLGNAVLAAAIAIGVLLVITALSAGSRR